jgi:hypothetical protein
VQLNVAVEAQQELAEDKTESIMVQKTLRNSKKILIVHLCVLCLD